MVITRLLADLSDALPLIAMAVLVLLGLAFLAGGVVMLFRCWNREEP